MRRTGLVISVSAAMWTASVSADARSVYGGGDGSSVQKAVVINADNETSGVAAEWEWLRSHLSGWRVRRQVLMGKAGRKYDRFTVVSPDGKQKEIYFDISKYFGKH